MHRAMESSFRPAGAREQGPALLDRIQRALADKDLEALAALYTEDATLEEVSSLSPPSHPVVAQGREAILHRLRKDILHDPVSGWSRNLESAAILEGFETEEGIAFTELRTYAAGDKALVQHVAHKHGGRIDKDRLLIAWDAD
jgi:hypothetical protein